MPDSAVPNASFTSSHSDELFRAALEAAPTGMLLIDAAGNIALVNAQVETLFGYSRAELMQRPLEMLVPQQHRAGHALLREDYFRDPQGRSIPAGREVAAIRKDGSELSVEIGLTPLSTSEGRFVLASIVDVTERGRAVEQLHQRTNQLMDLVRERDLLLQEVHHRVKNNLQLISSLINMQARKAASGESRLALAECKRRVEAIGLIHEKLYQSHNYAQVPFSDYVRTLASNLIDTSDAAAGIELECQCDNITLPVAKAISCGLLLNELIANLLNRSGGTLHVELLRVNDGLVRLGVGGLNTDKRAGHSDSLSMQLVQMLAQQLNGTLQTEPDGATAVTFPLTD